MVAHYEAKNKTVVECSGNGSSERRTEKAAEVRSSTSTTSARGSLGIIRGAHDEGKRGQEPRNAREVSDYSSFRCHQGGGGEYIRGAAGSPAAVDSIGHGA